MAGACRNINRAQIISDIVFAGAHGERVLMTSRFRDIPAGLDADHARQNYLFYCFGQIQTRETYDEFDSRCCRTRWLEAS